MKRVLILGLLLSCSSVSAAPSWYVGTINRIWANAQDGGFILTFSSPSSLSDCKHAYAYFLSSNLPQEMMDNSLSIALSSFHSGSTVGVVIDKDLNGEYCHVSSIDIRK